MSRLRELIKEQEDITAKLVDEGEALLKEEVKKLFDKHPNLFGLKWTQYAPYFNDGEPCVFSVNKLNYLTEDKLDEDEKDLEDAYDYDDYDWEDDLPWCWAGDDYNEELNKIKEPMKKDLFEFQHLIQNCDDLMKNFTEDGQIIAIRNKEIYIGEYSHD